ncbi:MAG TPA: hypothetical protein VFP50_20500 [Anaeromyxobacteraceae bacterium]|nr:hypothetical protein [Anaeromyxobacteraceae bacterium]
MARDVAIGSEVPLAAAALDLLAQQGRVGRLVSMPCLQCFEARPAEWRAAVIPPGLPASVEAPWAWSGGTPGLRRDSPCFQASKGSPAPRATDHRALRDPS